MLWESGDGPQVWIKRDDLSSPLYGGNKTRKLEFLLTTSKRSVLTFGPLGSHYVYSAALHAQSLGRSTAAALVPQHMTSHHELIHQEILKICDPVIELSANPAKFSGQMKKITQFLSNRLFNYQILPPGGTNPRGTLGYVLGALELASQVKAGVLPAPTKVFVPLGTGGTAVGIALGLAIAGLKAETIAVRVVPKMALPKISLSVLTSRTMRLLFKAGLRVPHQSAVRLTVQDGFSGGYAVPDASSQSAMVLAEKAGVRLETTYSAKTMAALISAVQAEKKMGGPYLFWQTFYGG